MSLSAYLSLEAMDLAVDHSDHCSIGNGGLPIELTNTVLKLLPRLCKLLGQILVEATDKSTEFGLKIPLYRVLVKSKHAGVNVC
jgi:hypothetical protein